MTSTIFFPNPNNLTPIKFMNDKNIIDYDFAELIDKMIESQSKTDDYELRMEIKRVLARDYYSKALDWLKRFKEAGWYRSDLI